MVIVWLLTESVCLILCLLLMKCFLQKLRFKIHVRKNPGQPIAFLIGL